MAPLPQSILRLSDLAARKPTSFDIAPGKAELAAISAHLELIDLRKLRFVGELRPQGRTDWHLAAQLGATVVQECVVTLDPVTSRIDEPVVRNYLADLEEIEGQEIEMPDDDSSEPLPTSVDLAQVMIEALSLALPAFPRADGAALGDATYTEPGQTPMTDDDAKPFAGLGALRDKLTKPEE